MTFPETLTPGSAVLSVVPSATIKEEWALMSKPLMGRSDGDCDGMDSGPVLEPMTKVPEGWREMRVPVIRGGGLDAEMVVPAIDNAEGFGVKV